MDAEQFNNLIRGLSSVTAALQASRSKDVISKPEAFKGEKGHNARRWLNQFDNWAKEQADLVVSEPKKIRAALNLMVSKAGDWANQYLTRSNDPTNSTPIFGGNWADFVTAFKGHFSSIDEEKQALADLKVLKQGRNDSVSDYAQAFTELASMTKLSDYDLQQQFIEGLTVEMRRLMGLASAVATTDPGSLSELIARANKLDVNMNNPALGIGRGGGRSQHNGGGGGGRDPNAMDVDATSTGRSTGRDEFLRRMRGRCFGCGNSSHTKKDCNRARNVTCNYCKRRGHLEQVCQDKFMGLERGRGQGQAGGNCQRIAAISTEDKNFLLFADQPNQAGSSSSTTTVAATQPAVNDALTAQIAQLNSLLSGLSSIVNKLQDF